MKIDSPSKMQASRRNLSGSAPVRTKTVGTIEERLTAMLTHMETIQAG